MHRKLAKRICALALTVLIAVFWGSSAFAASHIVDHNKTGALTITLRNPETQEPAPETVFALYFVGHLGEKGYNLYYEKTAGFAGYPENITNTAAPTLAQSLAEYADAEAVEAYKTLSTDSAGTVSFEDLPLGLYLVIQLPTEASPSFTQPFLVSLPSADPVTGYWLYEIDASPKVSAVLPSPIPTTPTPAPTPTKNPTPPEKLPQTGMLMWPIPVLTGIGLLLFLVGWALNKRESDET